MVGVWVSVGVAVWVCVGVGVLVWVGVAVADGVGLGVKVAVLVGVGVIVGVWVGVPVGVMVAVAVALVMMTTPLYRLRKTDSPAYTTSVFSGSKIRSALGVAATAWNQMRQSRKSPLGGGSLYSRPAE